MVEVNSFVGGGVVKFWKSCVVVLEITSQIDDFNME